MHCAFARHEDLPDDYRPAYRAGDYRPEGGRTGAVQCDRNTGTVISASSVRVTPPNTISRAREWP